MEQEGISPVLSSLPLTVIAVVGMSIAMTATYVITGNLRETMGERFIVEDVWFKTGKIILNTREQPKCTRNRFVARRTVLVGNPSNWLDPKQDFKTAKFIFVT